MSPSHLPASAARWTPLRSTSASRLRNVLHFVGLGYGNSCSSSVYVSCQTFKRGSIVEITIDRIESDFDGESLTYSFANSIEFLTRGDKMNSEPAKPGIKRYFSRCPSSSSTVIQSEVGLYNADINRPNNVLVT